MEKGKTLELLVDRTYKGPKYTIGHLYVECPVRGGIVQRGQRFCDTVEDIDRGLTSTMPLSVIKAKKVYGETAIPRGRYRVLMDQPSPLYQKKAQTDFFYKPFCNNMPRVDKVPGYSGILIHPGTDADSTLGCLVVGLNTIVGKVTSSRTTFKKLFEEVLWPAHLAGREIWITYR